jgi:hypothetical protein
MRRILMRYVASIPLRYSAVSSANSATATGSMAFALPFHIGGFEIACRSGIGSRRSLRRMQMTTGSRFRLAKAASMPV